MALSVTTKAYREKMAQAAGTTGILPKITHVAFGNGGVDGGLVPIAPTTEMTELGNELLRKTVVSVTYPVSTTPRYLGSLLPTELNGFDINEMALIDSDGDVAAIKRFTNKGKDAESTLDLYWDMEF